MAKIVPMLFVLEESFIWQGIFRDKDLFICQKLSQKGKDSDSTNNHKFDKKLNRIANIYLQESHSIWITFLISILYKIQIDLLLDSSLQFCK